MGKALIGTALTLVLLSLFTLPFQNPSSGGMVVNVMALLVSTLFLAVVVVLVYKKIVV